MAERITHWDCPKCLGTGRRIAANRAIDCFDCDGTGNAMVNGAKRAHQRDLAELDQARWRAAINQEGQ